MCRSNKNGLPFDTLNLFFAEDTHGKLGARDLQHLELHTHGATGAAEANGDVRSTPAANADGLQGQELARGCFGEVWTPHVARPLVRGPPVPVFVRR